MKQAVYILMILMSGVVIPLHAGSHETQAGNGGGDQVFEDQVFKIEGGTEVQHELWLHALNDAVLMMQNLYKFSKDKSNLVVLICLYASPYTIVDSEYKDPRDNEHRHARTFIDLDASFEIQWASRTEVYRTAFDVEMTDKNRRDLAIHEALHRAYPKLAEATVLDLQKVIISTYEKLDVKSYIQNWVPSLISKEQTILPFYLHDQLITQRWEGQCTITEGSSLLIGATGTCLVKFTHWSAPYNRDIWGVTPLTMDIEGDLQNTVREYNLGNLWLGGSVTRSYTVSAREVILRGEIDFDLGQSTFVGENEYIQLRNHLNQGSPGSIDAAFRGMMPNDILINSSSFLDLTIRCTTKKMGGEDIVLFVRLRPEF